MNKEQMQNDVDKVREEIRIAVKDYFVGTTRETEDGFVLDLGRAGAYHIIITHA